MVESRAEKLIKEVLEYLKQHSKSKASHVGFKSFHQAFYYLGTLQFDQEGEVLPLKQQT